MVLWFLAKRKWRRRYAEEQRAAKEKEESVELGNGVFFKYDHESSFSQRTDFKQYEDSLTDSTKTSSSSLSSETIPQNEPIKAKSARWNSCADSFFYKNQPLMPMDVHADGTQVDEEEALDAAMVKSKRLPTSAWQYSSNHIMVNNERRKRVIAPLTRCADLDALARSHAKTMADAESLFHANPSDFLAVTTSVSRLKSPTTAPISGISSIGQTTGEPTCDVMPATVSPKTHPINGKNKSSACIGKNVAKGTSVRSIHRQMMQRPSDRNNMLHRGYRFMGMGTARCVRKKEGTDEDEVILYLCQVFVG